MSGHIPQVSRRPAGGSLPSASAANAAAAGKGWPRLCAARHGAVGALPSVWRAQWPVAPIATAVEGRMAAPRPERSQCHTLGSQRRVPRRQAGRLGCSAALQFRSRCCMGYPWYRCTTAACTSVCCVGILAAPFRVGGYRCVERLSVFASGRDSSWGSRVAGVAVVPLAMTATLSCRVCQTAAVARCCHIWS